MSNPSKRKGTDGENAVVEYLIASGWPHVERRALAGAADRGDIAGIPGVAIEVKNATKLKWSEWLDEAVQEGINARADYSFLWAKRRGKGSPADWYVMLTGKDIVRLLKQAGY